MAQVFDVKNKKLILDFGYLQNVIFKDDMKRLDNIIKKLNILSVHNYSDLINFFRGAYVEKGYICLINSNNRKSKKGDSSFLDAVLRIELNAANQAWLEPGTTLGFYLDINLENPTLKIKNIFTTQMTPEAQPFETEFGSCPIEVVRFEKQIKPEQVMRECVINPLNVRKIKPLSNKFETEREKWANYLSFFGWYLKMRQANSELFLNLRVQKMIRVDKNDLHKTDNQKKALFNYDDCPFYYFSPTSFATLTEVVNYNECYVGVLDVLHDRAQDHLTLLKKQLELFLTPLQSNKNIENIFSDKDGFFDFSYSKKMDVNDFTLVANWIGQSDECVDAASYLAKTKTEFVRYFQTSELQSWLKQNPNLAVTQVTLELDNFNSENMKKYNLGYLAFIGAGEDALLDRMREVLKKVSIGQSKNPYLINYLFNTDLLSFNRQEEKYEELDFYNVLNDEQKLAVNRALHTKDIFVLQGPPGTGKTQVISEMIAQFAKRGQKVLVSSQSNDAIQNVLERIPDDVNINAVRFINKSYNKQENNLGLENIVANYYSLLDKAITTNIDFDSAKLQRFYQLRNELENLILNSQGMQETRNTIRKLRHEIDQLEITVNKLKDQKINLVKNRIELENEKFQVTNFIQALDDLIFDVAIENSRIITKVFENELYDDFNDLAKILNYNFEATDNLSKMFNEIFQYIKSRDINFNKYESSIINLKLLEHNAVQNEKQIKDLQHEIDFLQLEIKKNKFFNHFESLCKTFSQKLQGELYTFEFEFIETGDEQYIENQIATHQLTILNLEKQLRALRQQSSTIDLQINDEIAKLNQEFKFSLSILDPDMDEIAKEKLNRIEQDLKNKKRRQEFIGPLVKTINDFYNTNYKNNNRKTMNYDAKKYHATTFDNLVNVFAMTLTSPDKFKVNPSSQLYNYGIEEINLKFVDVDVVIVDEASKANLLELFMALMYGKVLILVGDYRQLPPIINLRPENVTDVNEKYNKNFQYEKIVSLLSDSPFKNLIASNNRAMISNLKLQYRSHKDIVNVMNYFYGQELSSDDSVEFTKNHMLDITGNGGHLINGRSAAYWIDSTRNVNDEIWYEQLEGYSNSLYNDLEIKIIMEMLLKINKEVKNKNLKSKPTVGLINFYALQAKKMRKAFEKIRSQIDALYVVIDTVDAFQGRESDYIFVSLVRNPQSLSSEFGREFLKRYERINVAFSRARKLLVIVGARRAIAELKVELPDYNNPNIVNIRAVYDDIYAQLWNKNATLTTKDILGDE